MTSCKLIYFSFPPQTPFTFGLNQRAPYTAGDRCLLCRCERKDTVVPSEASISGQNGTAQPAKTPSALQLPLWVCSDCRRTVEKEDRHTTLEQSLGVSHMSVKRIKVIKSLCMARECCVSSLCSIPPFSRFSGSTRMPHICSLTCTAAVFQWMMQLLRSPGTAGSVPERLKQMQPAWAAAAAVRT